MSVVKPFDLSEKIAQRIELEREQAVAVEIANSRLSTDEHPAAYCAVCGEPTGSDRPAAVEAGRGRELVVVHVACVEWKR